VVRWARDAAWWAVWYEAYRSFILTQARIAADAGATTLILGGPEIAPALPDGLLPDGTLSGAPADADARWRTLIGEVRAVFSGRVGFELDLGETLEAPPSFLDAVDEVHLAWHAPLTPGGLATVQSMQATAAGLLDQLVLPAVLASKPIVVHAVYASVEAAPATARRRRTARAALRRVRPGRHCRSAWTSIWRRRRGPQRAAARVRRPEIGGFYAAGDYQMAALLDKSTSPHGKPAQDVLTFWFPKLSAGSSSASPDQPQGGGATRQPPTPRSFSFGNRGSVLPASYRGHHQTRFAGIDQAPGHEGRTAGEANSSGVRSGRESSSWTCVPRAFSSRA
jgi:hypothetical protein